MRETDGLDPMWENDDDAAGSRLVRVAARALGGAARRLAPHALTWAEAQRPQLTVAWGLGIYHLQRGGIVRTRRAGEGWGDNPRRNYNDAVQKRQDRAARDDESATIDAEPAPEATEPAVDLSAAALEAAVRKTMGIHDEAEGSEHGAELSRDPEAVREQLSSVRSLLQALDDVTDYDLVEAVDEELYQLHKAVEYKLRNHKASEAKAQLHDLFK